MSPLLLVAAAAACCCEAWAAVVAAAPVIHLQAPPHLGSQAHRAQAELASSRPIIVASSQFTLVQSSVQCAARHCERLGHGHTISTSALVCCPGGIPGTCNNSGTRATASKFACLHHPPPSPRRQPWLHARTRTRGHSLCVQQLHRRHR